MAGSEFHEHASRRDRFAIPTTADGHEIVYLAGNSLGLMPRDAPDASRAVFEAWASCAVDGHFAEPGAWYGFEERLEPTMARLVGALPHEVSIANSLTVNLHLVLASFHRPTTSRRAILVQEGAFPSDRYAAETHVTWHGDDPSTAVVKLPRNGATGTYEADTLAAILARRRDVATVLLEGVNYFTGDVLDMAEMTSVAHDAGCAVVLDLAHAAGNVPLALHDWGVDAAVWCTYKYLNGGPGAPGAMFVHERHGLDPDVPRLAGWWGNDPATRFGMDENASFVPRAGASGWKLSNPPILAVAPLVASLAIFDEVGMDALRARSVALTGRLSMALDDAGFDVVTPALPGRRGCQLSIRVGPRADEVLAGLASRGVVADVRRPDVIRFAPTPLYSTTDDVDRAVRALVEVRLEHGF